MFSLAFITLFYIVQKVLHAAHMLSSCHLLGKWHELDVSETELEKYVRWYNYAFIIQVAAHVRIAKNICISTQILFIWSSWAHTNMLVPFKAVLSICVQTVCLLCIHSYTNFRCFSKEKQVNGYLRENNKMLSIMEVNAIQCAHEPSWMNIKFLSLYALDAWRVASEYDPI